MKGVKRRIMAFALAFAMVLGVCSGYSIGANAEEENTGLVAAWDGGWENGIPQKNTDESKYSSWFGCAIRQDITIYIGKSMNEKLSVQDAENISVTKDGQLFGWL